LKLVLFSSKAKQTLESVGPECAQIRKTIGSSCVSVNSDRHGKRLFTGDRQTPRYEPQITPHTPPLDLQALIRDTKYGYLAFETLASFAAR